MKKRVIFALCFLGVVIVFGTGCELIRSFTQNKLQPDGVDPSIQRYTAYNIWYEKVDSVWSTNYKAGMVIPAGTKVTNVKIGSQRNHPILAFTVPSLDNAEFVVHFNSRHHGNLAFSTFKNRMFTTKTFAELTRGFTAKEIEAIKSSQPLITKGMSKKAAVIAFGYPPEVATPSTNANAWKYWINRWKTIIVRFDKNGKATAEVQAL